MKRMASSPEDENPYESDFGRSNMYQSGPAPSKSTKMGKLRLVMEIIAALIIFVLLIVLVVQIHMEDESDTGTKMSSSSPISQEEIRSCMDLQNGGTTTSGFYDIQPDEKFKSIETYCDMETDGGGWTLVASVHEKDIKKKCETDDRWSKYTTGKYMKTNWANERVFGDARNCTDDDYKNSAYFAMNAKDVMVWHVSPEPANETMKMRASLRYRTTDHFLHGTGGNLKSLFENSYPLQVDNVYKERGKVNVFTSALLNALIQSAAEIKQQVPDWYKYDDLYGSSWINSGGRGLYTSSGNEVYIGAMNTNKKVSDCGEKLKFPSTDDYVACAQTDPFIFVSAVENKNKQDSFTIMIQSNRHRDGQYSNIEKSVKRGNLQLDYKATIYTPRHSEYPSPCEYHFVIYNEKDWQSKKPTSFQRTRQNFYGTTYQYRGAPSDVVIGYMLLARTKAKKVTEEIADGVASIILNIVSQTGVFSKIAPQDALVAPITFDKGNNSDVMLMIPPNSRDYVAPGYLQFRAYDGNGYPYALCLGVRMKQNQPEHVCIGGLSQDFDDVGTCGDFSGWAGEKSDSIHDEEATGNAHSKKEIESTILIFYR